MGKADKRLGPRVAQDMVPRNLKQPAFSRQPSITRVPRVADRSAPHGDHTVVWKFAIVDLLGPFGEEYGHPTNDEFKYLLDRCKEFESRRWVELDQSSKQYHFISWSSLCAEARKRIEELSLDDGRDQLYSLRLSGKERLYGLRINNVFCLLWWDRDHAVCPSDK